MVTTTGKKNPGRWAAGKSGNPSGRKPGTGEVAKLRASIAKDMPEIISQLVAKAKEDDAQAAKLLLERTIPAMKSIDQPVMINLPDGVGLAKQGETIIQSIASGTLTPSEGSALLASLGALAKIKEFDELEQRLTALEQENEHKK